MCDYFHIILTCVFGAVNIKEEIETIARATLNLIKIRSIVFVIKAETFPMIVYVYFLEPWFWTSKICIFAEP